MAYDPTIITRAIKDFVEAQGSFRGASIGPPDDAPDGLWGAVWYESTRLMGEKSSLSKGSGILTFNLRIYQEQSTESNEDAELRLSMLAHELMSAMAGDFDFGDANVRNLEPFDSFGADTSELEVKGRVYDIVDLTIPLLVNDIVTFTE